MNIRPARSAGVRGLLVAGLALCALAIPRAGLAISTLGGVDPQTQYTGAGTGSPEAGILTFDDGSGPGSVTSASAGLAALIGKSVAFEVILGPTRPNGNPFDPATDNVKKARFLGTGGYEFRIYDGSTTLLAFDIAHIDTTNATTAFLPLDPDGTITLGDPTVRATSSLLTLTGGSMNMLVGGLGSLGYLQVQLVSPSPGILTTADFLGLLNDNFTSGTAGSPVSATTWDLSIVPVPEPGSASLLGFALLGVVGVARRSGRKRQS